MTTSIIVINASPKDAVDRLRLAGMSRYAGVLGMRVVPVARENATADALRRMLAEWKPVGCIVSHSDSRMPVPPGVLRRLPTVHLECQAGFSNGDVCSVLLDNAAVGEMAFRELEAARPKAHALVRFSDPIEYSDVRAARFLALAREKGIDVLQTALPYFPCEASGRALAAWAASLPRGTAVFAVSDPLARRTAAALAAAHRAIPRDIRLLGVDNVRQSEPLAPWLSSIELDFEHEGLLAARMLCDVVSGRLHPPVSVTFGPRMVVRNESTRSLLRRTQFVSEAVDMIRREACDGLSADDLASRFRCSRSLFDLRFREAMGHSAYDEILHVRLAHVDTLLTRTKTRIDAIAGMCGFDSEHALRCLFRRRFGMSMRAWRRRHACP